MEPERRAICIWGDFFKCINLNNVFKYSVIEEGGCKESSTQMSILSTVWSHNATLIFILVFLFSPINRAEPPRHKALRGMQQGKKMVLPLRGLPSIWEE